MAQTTWATSTDVQQVTGVEVTDQQVTTAGYIIDNFTGRPYSFSWTEPTTQTVTTYNWHDKLGATDLYYLKLAVCYQTVWMLAQPDIMTRSDLSEIPGVREVVKIEPTAMTLGPLTKKALGRVSFLRSRSLHVRSPFEDLMYGGSVNFGEEDFPWAPIGGYPSPDY